HGYVDGLGRHLRYIDVVELGEQRPLTEGGAGGWGAELLVLELFGLGNAAAPARHDRERRLVVDHEYRSHWRRRMLIAIFDEGVDIGEAHVISARCNAGKWLGPARRPREGHGQG